MVGDLVLLEAGARVSADCILVEGSSVVVNTSYYPGADRDTPKHALTHANIGERPDCFILSQSIVKQGVGKAIVIAVGECSRRNDIPPTRLGITDEVTPLQERLTNLGSHFSKYGIFTAAAILAVLLVHWIIIVSAGGVDVSSGLKKFLFAPITALLIIVVAVPEGLPLSIGISLAYSTKTMGKHNILVKKLEAMEIMGTVEEIVTGKTGTITTEEMSVAAWYAMGRATKNKLSNTMCAYNSGFPQDWKTMVTDCIIFNSDARVEMSDAATYEPVG